MKWTLKLRLAIKREKKIRFYCRAKYLVYLFFECIPPCHDTSKRRFLKNSLKQNICLWKNFGKFIAIGQNILKTVSRV